MLRSLFAGISGLRANQTMLDVTGNNIANANTVGFKSSATVFQDTLSQMLTASGAPSATRGGTNPIQIGLGTQVAATNGNFTQGSNETTGVGTDMMISGDGFFVVSDGATQSYTRSGAFTFDASGNLVAPNGKYVQGYPATAYQGFVPGTPGSPATYTIPNPVAWWSSLDQSNYTPTTAQAATAAAAAAAAGDTAGEAAATTAGATPADITTAFSAGPPVVQAVYSDAPNGPFQTAYNTAYNASYATTYAAQVATFAAASTPDGDAGAINISNGSGSLLTLGIPNGLKLIGGVNPATATPQDIANALNNDSGFRQQFLASTDTTGNLVITAASNKTTTGGALQFSNVDTAGATIPITTTGELVTEGVAPTSNVEPVSTDFASNGVGTQGLSIINLQQNASLLGGANLQLQSYSIGSDGVVTGVYSDGSRLAIAKIAVANFSNPEGLTRSGNSEFMASTNSGEVQIAGAGVTTSVGQNGTFTVGSLEMSNVDLAAEFTNLILAQRGFEASSKVITTSDTVLGDLIGMIR